MADNKTLKLGNYAVARGAYEAGARVATAYPGTPSTEITEYLAKYPEINTEWAPNEKVALEVGLGAAVGGARSIVSMKHVGLNVAADPLFTAAYTGINAGLVIVTADDPGMHSSQNEQDSRYYALSAGVPMLEPSDSEEARVFTKKAFDLSEQFDMPVLLRMTTRVSHSQSYIEEEERVEPELKEYVKNISKYVMIPANAKLRHIDLESRHNRLAAFDTGLDKIEKGDRKLGVVCAGVVYQYVKEALPKASVYKIGLVNPLNINAIREFSKNVDDLLIIEELEPIIETQLKAAGIKCRGKEVFGRQGELSVNLIRNKLFGTEIKPSDKALVGRPPVLCAGCPHRGVFYVLNKLKLMVSGDIGCYSLGALPPLNATDFVVCMGASIGMAVGMEKARGREFAKKSVAVIGDSTFVHSGITGLINAVYNRMNTKVIVVDNSTTGMTGHQNHPGTGRNIRDEITNALSIEETAAACGVKNIRVADSFDIKEFEKILLEEFEKDGVSVIVARRQCALINKEKTILCKINNKCTKCKMCVKLGCPAIEVVDSDIKINGAVCTGCGVCRAVCKFGAIEEVRENGKI